MNEREWGKKFREETDELLFGDLQFDESLKQKVRDKIAAEAGSAETDAADAPMRTRRALRRPRLRKAYGVMLAASVVVVVAAAGAFGGLLKPDHNGLYTAGHEGAEIMMTPETVGGTNEFPGWAEGHPADASGHYHATDPDAPQILLAPEETDESKMAVTVELDDWQQAKLMFGDELRKPVNVPEGYEVVRMFAKKPNPDGEVTQVIVQYASSADRMFTYIQSKYGDGEFVPSDVDEQIDMHGTVGYLKTGPDHLELSWTDGTFVYQISGALSRDALIEAARSVGQEE